MHTGLDLTTTTDAAKEQEGILAIAKRGLFGALFELKQRKISSHERFYYLSTLIMSLQLTYLAFSHYADFMWPTQFALSVRSALEVFAFGFIEFGQSSVFLLLLGLSVVMVLMLYLGIITLALDEINHHSTSARSGLVLPLSTLLRLNQTMLQIPVIAILSRGMRGESMELLPAGMSSVLSVVSSIFLLLHLAATSLFALCVIDHLPFGVKGYDKTLYAAPHGRVEFAATILRACAAVLFTTLGAGSTESIQFSSQVALVVLNLVISALLVGVYFHWLPWFNNSWNRFSVGCYTVYLWSGVCAGVAQIVNDRADRSSMVLFTISLPFSLVSMLSLCIARSSYIKSIDHSKLVGNPFLLEAQLRLRFLSNLKQNVPFAFEGDAETEYRRAAELVPSSPFLNLAIASIVVACSKKVIYSLNLLKQARQATNAFDMEFMLFYHNKMTREQRMSNSSDVNFLEADTHIAQAKSSLISTLKNTASFWRKICHGSFTSRELLDYGGRVHTGASAVRQALQRLNKLKVSNKETIQIHAMYYQFVMNDRDTAYRIIAKGSSSGMGDSGSASICTISGDKGSLGQILDMSKGLLEMFGYSRSDLIGQNVSVLCPQPFQSVHDLFLQQFLALDNDFVSQARRVFGMHQAGYVMVLDLEITPNISLGGELILAAKFSHVPDSGASNLLLMDSKSGCITGVSKHGCELLGIDEHDLYTMNVHMKDLIPTFFDLKPNEEHEDIELSTMPETRYKLRFRAVQYKSKPESPVAFDINICLIWLTVQDTHYSIHEQLQSLRMAQEMEDGDDDEVDSTNERCSDVEEVDLDQENGDVSIEKRVSTLDNRGSTIDNRGSTTLDNRGSTGERGSGIETRGSTMDVRASAIEGRPSVGDDGKKNAKIRPVIKVSPESSSPKAGSPKRKLQMMKNDFFETRSTGSKSKQSKGMGSSSDAGRTDNTSQTSETRIDDISSWSIRQIQKRIARNLQKKDPKMMAFRQFGKRFIALFFSCVVAEAVIKIIFLDTVRGNIVFVGQSFDAAASLTTIGLLLLYNHTRGAYLDGEVVPRQEYDHSTLLESTYSLLKASHTTGANFALGKGKTSTLYQLYHDPSLTIVAERAEDRTISFNVAVLEVVGHIESYRDEDNGECLESCHFILNNVMTEIFETNLSIIGQVYLATISVMETADLVDRGIFYTVIALLGASFVVGYVPMFRNNEHRKNRIGHAFLAIPENVAKNLQQRAERRLALVQNPRDDWFSVERDDLDFETEMELDLDAENDKDKTEENKGENNSGKGGGIFGFFTTLRSKPKVEPVPGGGRPTRKDKKVKRAMVRKAKFRGVQTENLFRRAFMMLWNVLQVGVTFWFVLGFFSVLSSRNELAKSEIDSQSSILYYGSKRLSLYNALTYWSVIPSDPPSWESRNPADVRSKMSQYLTEMKTFNAALKYGNDSLSVPPFTATSGDTFTLYFENACNEECLTYLAAPESTNPVDTRVSDLKHGLFLALDRKMAVFEETIETYGAYVDDPSNETFTSLEESKVKLNNFLPQRLVDEQISVASTYKADHLYAALNDMKMERIVLCCIFAFLLIVGHVLSLRTFERMDRDLKKSQTLLLVLPEQVFQNVPSIVALLNDF